jgi:hypothetical protein
MQRSMFAMMDDFHRGFGQPALSPSEFADDADHGNNHVSQRFDSPFSNFGFPFMAGFDDFPRQGGSVSYSSYSSSSSTTHGNGVTRTVSHSRRQYTDEDGRPISEEKHGRTYRHGDVSEEQLVHVPASGNAVVRHKRQIGDRARERVRVLGHDGADDDVQEHLYNFDQSAADMDAQMDLFDRQFQERTRGRITHHQTRTGRNVGDERWQQPQLGFRDEEEQ